MLERNRTEEFVRKHHHGKPGQRERQRTGGHQGSQLSNTRFHDTGKQRRLAVRDFQV